MDYARNTFVLTGLRVPYEDVIATESKRLIPGERRFIPGCRGEQGSCEGGSVGIKSAGIGIIHGNGWIAAEDYAA